MSLDPKKVEQYYDKMTQSYLETYGSTIQAFRPKDTDKLHWHVLESASISDGLHILDVGCGVAAPAIFFAKRKNVHIHGITISQVQIDEGLKAIEREHLLGNVSLTKGDFHELDTHFEPNSFDRILFLESLGHANDSASVLRDSYNLLKPGGSIYIKDFYPLQIADEAKKRINRTVIERINEAYAYNVLDLNETITSLRQAGFEIDFIRRFDFEDDIEARSAFETANGIDLYEGLEKEFRVAEWLEIACIKPEFPLF